MSSLSPKQLEVLAFIRQFMEERGLPPTRGEIADGLGLKNRQGIDQHLRALQTKGAIELAPGISRGIRLCDERQADIASAGSRDLAPASHLPLVGRIAAGAPILAIENVEEHVAVDGDLFAPRAHFLLRVRGDSMKDANILDRDLLAVHRTSEARDGQIVVARIDDEATVKFFERRGERVRLKPANADYAPIDVDLRRQQFTIEGLAVGVVRREIFSGRTSAR